jgi:hypothetical protein
MNQFTSLAVGFTDLELVDYRVVSEQVCVSVTTCPQGQQQCNNRCRQFGGSQCAGTCTLDLTCLCGDVG